MKKEIEKIINENMEEWRKLHNYIDSSENYLQYLKDNNASEIDILQQRNYLMQLIIEANTIYRVTNKLKEIIKGVI